MNKYTLGYLQMLVSATSFAFSSVMAKLAYARGFSPLDFTLGISLLTVLLFTPMLRRQAWSRPTGTPLWMLVLYPVCGAASGLLFNTTLLYLDISLATLLLFIYPAAVVLGAWLFFRQRPTGLQSVAVGLTLAGAVLTAGPIQAHVQLLGIGLALATMVSQTGFMLLGERVLTGWDTKASVLLTRVITTVVILVLQPAAGVALAHLSWSSLAFLLGASFVCVIIPFLLLLEGVSRLGASRAAIISTVELPIALFLGWSLFGDPWSLLQGVGALLIGLALLLINRPEPGLAHAD